MGINGPSGVPPQVPENNEQIKKKILIVEDVGALAKALKRYLEMSGYEVFTAATEEEALSLLDKQKPDLVTMDGDLEINDETGKLIKTESGLDIAAKMRERDTSVVITMNSARDLKFEGRGIKKGAGGPGALLNHIESLLAEKEKSPH